MLSWLVIGVGDISRKRVIPAILAEPGSRLAGIVTRDPANSTRRTSSSSACGRATSVASAAYAFQARALAKDGYSDWSDSVTFMCT